MEWISVKDRLPEETGGCLAYIYSPAGKPRICVQKYYASSRGWQAEGVTNWMPLPDPPEEEA